MRVVRGLRQIGVEQPEAPVTLEALRTLVQTKSERARGDCLYHQMRPEHLTVWRRAVRWQGVSALRRWLCAGEYPGLWTVDKPEGFLPESKHHAAPIRFSLKPGQVFFPGGLGLACQACVPQALLDLYDQWRALQPNPDRWALRFEIRDLPRYAQFFRDLGLAGISTVSNTFILFNPDAVSAIEFPTRNRKDATRNVGGWFVDCLQRVGERIRANKYV
jgi:hypothetical protein